MSWMDDGGFEIRTFADKAGGAMAQMSFRTSTGHFDIILSNSLVFKVILLGRFLNFTLFIYQIDVSIIVIESVIIISIQSLTVKVQIVIFQSLVALTILTVS